MKEILLGIGMTLVPQLIAIFMGKKKRRALGKLASKWLRKTVGKVFEHTIEETLNDFLMGMMEDNDPHKAIAIEKAKKHIEDIRDSSPI